MVSVVDRQNTNNRVVHARHVLIFGKPAFWMNNGLVKSTHSEQIQGSLSTTGYTPGRNMKNYNKLVAA